MLFHSTLFKVCLNSLWKKKFSSVCSFCAVFGFVNIFFVLVSSWNNCAGLILWWPHFKEAIPEHSHCCNIRMLFLRFEEISYAVGYLATLTFPLLYLKSWQEQGTYNTKRKIFPLKYLSKIFPNKRNYWKSKKGPAQAILLLSNFAKFCPIITPCYS